MRNLPVPFDDGRRRRQLDRMRHEAEGELLKERLAVRADELLAEAITRATANLGESAVEEIDLLAFRGRQAIRRNADCEAGVAAVVTEAEVAMARLLRRFANKQLDRMGGDL